MNKIIEPEVIYRSMIKVLVERVVHFQTVLAEKSKHVFVPVVQLSIPPYSMPSFYVFV